MASNGRSTNASEVSSRSIHRHRHRHHHRYRKVKRAVNMCSRPGYLLILGVLIVLVGFLFTIIGYCPRKIFGSWSGNVTADEWLSARQLQPSRLKVVGPLLMGIGLFMLVASNAVLQAQRFRKAKVLIDPAEGAVEAEAKPKIESSDNEGSPSCPPSDVENVPAPPFDCPSQDPQYSSSTLDPRRLPVCCSSLSDFPLWSDGLGLQPEREMKPVREPQRDPRRELQRSPYKRAESRTDSPSSEIELSVDRDERFLEYRPHTREGIGRDALGGHRRRGAQIDVSELDQEDPWFVL
uniref:uncharacterized protein n=1 Tax=Myxine glutinosa TaxID=7769 RepID=UPI00358FADC6